jgi:hypothetical protein
MAGLSRVTLRGNQVRLRLPPQAARTVGPPGDAGAPMNQSREADYAAWLLHSPRGELSWPDVLKWRGQGYAIGRCYETGPQAATPAAFQPLLVRSTR